MASLKKKAYLKQYKKLHSSKARFAKVYVIKKTESGEKQIQIKRVK